MSGYSALQREQFKPADGVCPLVIQFVSDCSVLLNPKPDDDGCSWFCREMTEWKWVVAVPHCSLSLLMIPFLTLQTVSACSALLSFKPVHNSFSWLSSLWVAAVPCYVSNLLMTLVLHSSGCERLQCVVVILPLLRHLSFALQRVCGCSLLCFNPAKSTYTWLTRQWVAVMPCHVLTPLMARVFGSSVGEWLSCIVWLPTWWCLSLFLRMWVATCWHHLTFSLSLSLAW